MKIPCEHWRDCGISGGGCCAAGKFGGRPSTGICLIACLNRPDLMPATETVQARIPTAEELAAAEAIRLAGMRATWAAIHRTAAAGKLTDAALDAIVRTLPCGTCLDHFKSLRDQIPLPADPAQQFKATWAWHEAVNAQLGKPGLSFDEARKLYPAGAGGSGG